MANTFCSGGKEKSGLRTTLVLRVNKRHVCKSDESQNVEQVGFLKIESSPRSALFIGSPARSDNDNFLTIFFLARRPCGPFGP
jgi:hypothetical protein